MRSWDSRPDSPTLGPTFLTTPLYYLPALLTPYFMSFSMLLFQGRLISLFSNRDPCAHSWLHVFTSGPQSWMSFLNLSSLGSKWHSAPGGYGLSWSEGCLRRILSITMCKWQWFPTTFLSPDSSSEHLGCAICSSSNISFPQNLRCSCILLQANVPPNLSKRNLWRNSRLLPLPHLYLLFAICHFCFLCVLQMSLCSILIVIALSPYHFLFGLSQ